MRHPNPETSQPVFSSPVLGRSSGLAVAVIPRIAGVREEAGAEFENVAMHGRHTPKCIVGLIGSHLTSALLIPDGLGL